MTYPPPVRDLSDEEVDALVTRGATKNPLHRTSREKDAWREQQKRRPSCDECGGEIVWDPIRDNYCDNCRKAV